MIKSASDFKVTLEEVESIFNAFIEKELENFENEKKRFLEEVNKTGEVTRSYMPYPQCSVWLTIPRTTIERETEEALLADVEKAGWDVVVWKWQEDERTGKDQLYINVRAKNSTAQ
jgi:hypothetical protein